MITINSEELSEPEYTELFCLRIRQIHDQVEARIQRSSSFDAAEGIDPNADYLEECVNQYNLNLQVLFSSNSILVQSIASQCKANGEYGISFLHRQVGQLYDSISHLRNEPISTNPETLEEIVKITSRAQDVSITIDQLKKEVFFNPLHKYKFVSSYIPQPPTSKKEKRPNELW